MKEYVLVFAHSLPDAFSQHVTLIDRVKDDWQKGRLNLPGGEVHVGYETVEQAAIRELREETGVEGALDVRVLGRIQMLDCVVHVVWVPYRVERDRNRPRTTAPNEGKIVQMNYLEAVIDLRLIPNLQIIIPLCLARVEGWVLTPGSDDQTWNVQLNG